MEEHRSGSNFNRRFLTLALRVLIGAAVLALAWSVFSRFAAESKADEMSYLWAGAVFVALIGGIVIISLLFSWLQRREEKKAEARTVAAASHLPEKRGEQSFINKVAL